MVSADYTAEKKTPNNEYAFAAGLAYGEQNSMQTADNYKASFQWNYLITQRFYNYQRDNGLRDYIADIDYRLVVGEGLGYYLLKSTNTTLAVELGANFEAQELGGQVNNFATVRLADRFERKFDHSRIWQSVEIFPQVDRLDNYVVNFQIGMETTIWKTLLFKSYLEDSYNQHPAAQHLKNDMKLVTGIGYKF